MLKKSFQNSLQTDKDEGEDHIVKMRSFVAVAVNPLFLWIYPKNHVAFWLRQAG